MSVSIGDQQVDGFQLEREEWVQEIETTVRILRHEKTGAEVALLPNSDDNKVFMITFRTPPDDDAGVAHILEHSVLNGSRKYPVKEPFAELLKSSLYTFLNAMTYPDRTVYPVASRNDRDFRNLMDVYLDAVFYPLLSRETFMQEGWHYEMESTDGELAFSGVVYNEMLGATSGADSILSDEMDKALFPNSTYGLNSGGDPEAIPTLTYEQFIDFHRRFYHPSNSRTVLYGDMDIAASLAHLASYFDGFEAMTPASDVVTQPRWSAPVTTSATYPISEGEPTAAQSYVMRAWLLEQETDAESHLALQILDRILVGNPASPLHKALIDSGLGQDAVCWGAQQDLLDVYFAVGMRGTEPDRADRIVGIVDACLRGLVADGIDPLQVEAAVNSTEFRLREANFGGYSKGLIYALGMVSNWIYDGDPLMHLYYEETLATVKAGIAKGGYFEGLIQRLLIDNPHHVTLTLTPDLTHEERRQDRLEERLRVLRDSFDEARRTQIIADCERLQALQDTPDTPEALASIPKLPLNCVKREIEVFPFELVQERTEGGHGVSFSEQPTNGIAYVKLVFDAGGLPQELLPYLTLFGRFTSQTGTANQDYVALTQQIGIHTGGIGAGSYQSPRAGDPSDIVSTYGYNGKALCAKLPELMALATEMITSARLDNVPRLLEIARASRAKVRAGFVGNGHSYAGTRLGAYHSLHGHYSEQLGGLSQYDFQGSLVTALETDPASVVARLEAVRDAILRRGNLHVHLTGGRDELAALQAALPRLLEALPDGTTAPVAYSFAPMTENEALVVPAKIQYVGKGVNLFDLGYQYNGAFEVLSKYINREYLWQQVRVQGNAYGCFARLNSFTGSFYCVSYRDPHLDRTLKVFDGIGDMLAKTELHPAAFEAIQIGTMGSVDSPLTPDQKGAAAFNHYQLGITSDFRQNRRHEILDATPGTLAEHAELLREFATRGSICVVGGADAIAEATTKFATVRQVFADK